MQTHIPNFCIHVLFRCTPKETTCTCQTLTFLNSYSQTQSFVRVNSFCVDTEVRRLGLWPSVYLFKSLPHWSIENQQTLSYKTHPNTSHRTSCVSHHFLHCISSQCKLYTNAFGSICNLSRTLQWWWSTIVPSNTYKSIVPVIVIPKTTTIPVYPQNIKVLSRAIYLISILSNYLIQCCDVRSELWQSQLDTGTRLVVNAYFLNML